MMIGFQRALWGYRGFILGSVKREFQSKYRNSLLGAAWSVIQPLAMIVVYTIIFSQVMKTKLPGTDTTFAYSIHLCAGIISWGLLAEISGRTLNIFLEHANLLKKLSFPRLCLPVIVVLNACLNFAIILGLFLCFLIAVGHFPGWPVLALFPLLAIQIAFSVGLGINLGVLNVFFRDVGQLFTVMLQFWFWLTPIVYPVAILPEAARSIVQAWNPMAPLITAYQDIFVLGQWPEWGTLLMPTTVAVAFCILGLRLFRKRASEMLDEL